MSFRRTFVRAAAQAAKEGTISRAEFRKLWWVSWSKIDEIEDYAWQAACAAGYAQGDKEGFDWTALLEFLRGLMPLILEIIDALN